MNRYLAAASFAWVVGILLAMWDYTPPEDIKPTVYVEPEPQCWGCYVEIDYEQ